MIIHRWPTWVSFIQDETLCSRVDRQSILGVVGAVVVVVVVAVTAIPVRGGLWLLQNSLCLDVPCGSSQKESTS